ncbi:hypothetical protein [Williamsia muralis]|uniref:Uncharacterized protein n=1 Tax=Williamsia marianensis TaxID=85044 RepID=A0ABU4ERR9_WILMA|nr:hypothetical protein [Williamsia muralis]MDV7133923.1 hypothetical protein [Williamsia muralis]
MDEIYPSARATMAWATDTVTFVPMYLLARRERSFGGLSGEKSDRATNFAISVSTETLPGVYFGEGLDKWRAVGVALRPVA